MDRIIEYLYDKYLGSDTQVRKYLSIHSVKVYEKALQIMELNPDKIFDTGLVFYGSMLHDIGVIFVDAPEIGCYGKHPYICHGYLGRKIMKKEGLKKIAKICERHVGVGLSKEEILNHNLPLPKRDMLPLSLEEKLICLADKFYSKSSGKLEMEKSIEQIRKSILKYGDDKLEKLNELLSFFRLIN